MKLTLTIYTVIREDLDGDFNPIDIFIDVQGDLDSAEIQIEKLEEINKGIYTYRVEPREIEVEIHNL